MNPEILEVLYRYTQIALTDEFQKHVHKLSERLEKGIKRGYSKKKREEKIVSMIENIVNSIGSFSTTGHEPNSFLISTESIFIHGQKSIVEFDYYGNRTQREFGDIIFIVSVVYKNKKFFEKMTINQVKKANKNPSSWSFSSKENLEQLYLLSRFPPFKGVSGIIPKKKIWLPNYSKCLGTHGLLYPPGDFAVISSRLLERIIPSKRTIKLADLVNLHRVELYSPIGFNNCIDDWIELCIHLCLKGCLPTLCSSNCWGRLPVLSSSCIAYNILEFAEKYLLSLIGELIYGYSINYNKQAFEFLHSIMSTIKTLASKEDTWGKYSQLVDLFYKYKYAKNNGINPDPNIQFNDLPIDGGGIGIVYTTISLGREL
ncbi:hypothetical protein [Thermococcus paralvinellae]|uniref:Uncharacterized protein n=1 Tax=Thermococcus paralvinellae TaxID=582419 RepID=W0I4T5_9EURY|nr:hypothetical protein [Thermococcus paralvinellae]AHF81121.1 Hypothetical protein TES1_1746 [Thermococcus paralvinellae]